MPVIGKICVKCDKSFTKSTVGDNYCSFKCKVSSENISYSCVICNTKYHPNTPHQKYCGKQCLGVAVKQHNAEIREKSRFSIFARDNFQCVYCGSSSIEDGVKLHLDHIFPLDLGGDNDPINLITACERCNLEKSVTLLNKDQILQLWNKVQRSMSTDKETDYNFLRDFQEKQKRIK